MDWNRYRDDMAVQYLGILIQQEKMNLVTRNSGFPHHRTTKDLVNEAIQYANVLATELKNKPFEEK